MDQRCPRQLEEMPDKWCPLAVLRLKAIRNAGRELTEEEEATLPGCPWAIDHQLAHYCFFKYLSEFTQDRNISDLELAALLNVSVDTIKKIEKSALSKMREHESFKDIKGSEPIVSDQDVDFKVHK
jgi:hypothetical protein